MAMETIFHPLERGCGNIYIVVSTVHERSTDYGEYTMGNCCHFTRIMATWLACRACRRRLNSSTPRYRGHCTAVQSVCGTSCSLDAGSYPFQESKGCFHRAAANGSRKRASLMQVDDTLLMCHRPAQILKAL